MKVWDVKKVLYEDAANNEFKIVIGDFEGDKNVMGMRYKTFPPNKKTYFVIPDKIARLIMPEEFKVKLNLTESQQKEICSIIGEWYIEWKEKIVEHEGIVHKFGFAKEDLKQRICEEIK